MDNIDRKFVRTILMYVLEKKGWDFDVEDDGEISFILGNQEPTTRNKSVDEIENLIEQVVRW